jgi:hypothetical protein
LKKWFDPPNFFAAVALFFDPRFKRLECLQDAEIKAVKMYVQEELKTMDPPAASNITPEELEENRKLGINVIRSTDADDEMVRYQCSPRVSSTANPLQWWKDNHQLYPRIARLAKKYLCVPATSVPSERTFSSASNVDTKHRSRLDPETLELCVILHHFLCEKKRSIAEFKKQTVSSSNIPVLCVGGPEPIRP